MLYVLISGVFSYAQHYINQEIVQNNVTYDISDIIVDDAPLHFTSVGAIIGNWSAYAMDENGNYVELDKLNYATNEYEFDPSAIVWNNIERTFEDSINSWIFKVKISFLRTQNVKEDIFVNISLLPSKPVITDIDFQYEYDWINDYMSFDSEFLFNVQSDRVDDYWLYCSDSNNFKDESEPFFRYIWTLEFKEFGKAYYSMANWGENICVLARNKYGSVRSDTIFTTDYIYDTDVLKRIDELHHKSSLNRVKENIPDDICYEDDILYCSEEVLLLQIYDLSGRIVFNVSTPRTVDISGLKTGLYIVSIRSRENKCKSLKIQKK